ncbi:hypothetical protein [Streptomyces collinus]|uniref:hypothetical protein n=1 Tax=Streptomyces collinus TaxID=42684 RepID=UPI00331CFA67
MLSARRVYRCPFAAWTGLPAQRPAGDLPAGDLAEGLAAAMATMLIVGFLLGYGDGETAPKPSPSAIIQPLPD